MNVRERKRRGVFDTENGQLRTQYADRAHQQLFEYVYIAQKSDHKTDIDDIKSGTPSFRPRLKDVMLVQMHIGGHEVVGGKLLCRDVETVADDRGRESMRYVDEPDSVQVMSNHMKRFKKARQLGT